MREPILYKKFREHPVTNPTRVCPCCNLSTRVRTKEGGGGYLFEPHYTGTSIPREECRGSNQEVRE